VTKYKIDELEKGENPFKTSFRRKPESNYFWMPDQVRHDGFGTFYEYIKIEQISRRIK
jgi:hypothetical protein